MLRKLERFAVNPYDSSTVFNEQDRMPFTYIEGYLDFSITVYIYCIELAASVLINSIWTGRNISLKNLYRLQFYNGLRLVRDLQLQVYIKYPLTIFFPVKVGVWESLLSEMSEPLSESAKVSLVFLN